MVVVVVDAADVAVDIVVVVDSAVDVVVAVDTADVAADVVVVVVDIVMQMMSGETKTSFVINEKQKFGDKQNQNNFPVGVNGFGSNFSINEVQIKSLIVTKHY